MQTEEDEDFKIVQLWRSGISKCDDPLRIIQMTEIQVTLFSKRHIIYNNDIYNSSTIIPISGVVVKNPEGYGVS